MFLLSFWFVCSKRFCPLKTKKKNVILNSTWLFFSIFTTKKYWLFNLYYHSPNENWNSSCSLCEFQMINVVSYLPKGTTSFHYKYIFFCIKTSEFVKGHCLPHNLSILFDSFRKILTTLSAHKQTLFSTTLQMNGSIKLNSCKNNFQLLCIHKYISD